MKQGPKKIPVNKPKQNTSKPKLNTSKPKLNMSKPKLTTENLFLLEFLVDDLNLESRCDCGSPGELCVSFQFLDNVPLDVCEGDFCSGGKFGQDGNSKTGKSCLFSLTPTQAQKILNSFDLTVDVVKKMQPGWEPERSIVGTAKVSVLQLFLDLISNIDATSTAKVLQESYPLVDAKGMKVGLIGVYVRMSCYGKMIITQFQMNMDDKSVLFKDKDGHSLYRYKKSKKGKTTKIEDLSGKNQRPPCDTGYEQMYSQNQPQMYNSPDFNCPMQQPGGSYPGGSGGNYPPFNYSMQPPFSSGGYPPPNPNCPMQPCFPSNGPGGSFPPPNLNCPTQPCFPQNANMGPPCLMDYESRQKSRPTCAGGCR